MCCCCEVTDTSSPAHPSGADIIYTRGRYYYQGQIIVLGADNSVRGRYYYQGQIIVLGADNILLVKAIINKGNRDSHY